MAILTSELVINLAKVLCFLGDSPGVWYKVTESGEKWCFIGALPEIRPLRTLAGGHLLARIGKRH